MDITQIRSQIFRDMAAWKKELDADEKANPRTPRPIGPIQVRGVDTHTTIERSIQAKPTEEPDNWRQAPAAVCPTTPTITCTASGVPGVTDGIYVLSLDISGIKWTLDPDISGNAWNFFCPNPSLTCPTLALPYLEIGLTSDADVFSGNATGGIIWNVLPGGVMDCTPTPPGSTGSVAWKAP